MIMLILTILGITVMNMTTLEEKMAFNTQDRYRARYMAESAILFLAREDNLPSPNQAGFSQMQFANLEAAIPELQMAAGTGQVVYMQSTAINNLTAVNPNASYVSGGSTVNTATGESPNAGVPVFQITVSATTDAGTVATNARAGYFFVGATTLMQQ
jgi:Tfp pilus assembly protein PilX